MTARYRIGILIFGAAIAALGRPHAALAASTACVKGDITVTGIVSSLGIVQEEPAETPQFSFWLKKASCGKDDILVGGPEPILCSEGEFATVHGEYSPPDAILHVAIIEPAKVTCAPAKGAH